MHSRKDAEGTEKNYLLNTTDSLASFPRTIWDAGCRAMRGAITEPGNQCINIHMTLNKKLY